MIEPTEYDGIQFYESRPIKSRVIRSAKVEIGGIIAQAQLRTLNDVKREMAKLAKEAGGNAIVGFQYGQASVGFWRSLLQLDDINWYGQGDIAVV